MSGRRRLTASGRVALATLSVLVAGVALLSSISYFTVLRGVASNIDSELLREVQAYGAAIAPTGAQDERTLSEASRAYLEGRTGAESGRQPIMLVKFTSGKVLSNSVVPLETAADDQTLLDPANATRGFANVMFDDVEYRTVTAPILDAQGATVAVFQAALPTDEVRRLARELALSLALSGLGVIIVGSGLSVWTAHRSLAPLHEMAESASHISSASLGDRISYDGPDDELGVLATSIDHMLDRLEEAFAEQRRFVADASHELRTPVAIIRGNLDILHEPWIGEPEREESLRIIDEEVRRMQRLLDDLLSLARTQGTSRRPLQPLEVSSLMNEVVAKGRALGERTISSACGQEMWVMGDPDLLEQALLNIVRNAVEHTAEGGHIGLTCTAGPKTISLAVRDDGPGIRDEDLPRLFDRFYRAQGPRSSATGGSGLGLAISQRLVEQHGGTISVANADGGGAKFIIELPRIQPPDDVSAG